MSTVRKDIIQLLQLYYDSGIEYFFEDAPQNRCLRKSNDVYGNLPALEDLKKEVKSLNGIGIKKYAKNTVFGDGNPEADLMLIGEAPGATEDEKGIPFCGVSGMLLDNILLSIGIDRSMCYITNTVFWRPPANRRPTQEEIEICRPFVEKHIGIVNPRAIILVGSTAVESLLSINKRMHDLRKENFKYKNPYIDHSIEVFVVFHPSYLLRQPKQKKLMWEDMQKIKRFLNNE